METAKQKAIKYCKEEICPTCADNMKCKKEEKIGICTPTYSQYDSFMSAIKIAERFIPISDELPQFNLPVIVKSKYSNGEITYSIVKRVKSKDNTGSGWHFSSLGINSYYALTVLEWRPLFYISLKQQ